MNIKKTILSAAVVGALAGTLVQPVQAEILTFSFDGLFTIVDASINPQPIHNDSYPYYGDTTWAYGARTQITGSMSLDTYTGAGTGTINPFDFLFSGPAVAHDIRFQAIGDVAGSPGSLIIGNMLFDWNGNNNIAIEVVLDASGLFGCLQNGMALYTTCEGVGALGATDSLLKGAIPMGPLPVAMTSLDTDGVSITGDDGVGGSPMDNGPFQGFSANFDMTSVTSTDTCGFDPGSYAVTSCTPPPPIPVPAAVWLFGSGIISLAGVARRRKKVNA